MNKVIYIASTSYTGSTLLSILLGSHPDATTVSELKGINRGLSAETYDCSCGQKMSECSFWGEIKKMFEERCDKSLDLSDLETKFYEGKSRVCRNFIYRSLRNNKLENVRDFFAHSYVAKKIRKWQENNEAIIQCCLELSDKECFIDASKDPYRINYLAKSQDFELYVVHMVRDARGFANSCRKNLNQDIRSAATKWSRQHSEIERITNKNKLPYMMVKYEDFTHDPLKCINNISEFVGINHVDTVKFNPKDQHLLGNSMRLRPAIEIRTDLSWQSQLTSEEKSLVSNLTSKKMTDYGYEF